MTRHARIAAKRDGNEATLVEYWRVNGYTWIPAALDAGFDGLLIGRGNVFIVEIKNPEYKWKFTQSEINMIARCADAGVPYNVIETEADAARLIGEGDVHIAV
jgi:hypothetical protein